MLRRIFISATRSERFSKLISSRAFQYGIILLLVANLLYVIGFEPLLPFVLILLPAYFLPMPGLFRSLLSRSVISSLIFFANYQLMATMQFIFFPDSGFNTASILITFATIAMLLLLGDRKYKPHSLVSREDFCALLVALFFVAPLLAFGLSGNTINERITSIGAIQGNDGATHYSILADATVKERMTYEKGAIYYPVGFHLTTGFIEDAYGVDRTSFDWSGNAKLYIAEFMIYASLLSYVLYFAILCLLELLSSKRTKWWPALVVAGSLAPVLVLFYTVPFLYHGFLNYYYVCSALIIGFIFLLYEYEDRPTLRTDKSRDKGVLALIGMLLLFGATSSWPLFVPIVIVIAILLAFPNRIKLDMLIISKHKKPIILLVIGILLQLIPLYLQFAYANVATSEGLNATGGLRIFHPQFFILTVFIITYMAYSHYFSNSMKRLVIGLLTPLLLFIICLGGYQYFHLGEVRYYVIKLSMFLEIMTLVFLIALLADGASRVKLSWEKVLVLTISLPMIVFFSLFSFNDNPLRDLRDLFRTYSGQQKPAYIDNDVREISELGATGKLKNYNVVALHFTDDQTKIFAHPQTAYWANSLTYQSSLDNSIPKSCLYDVYMNILLGTFTESEQADLVVQVNKCAALARDNGRDFFIVTDEKSAEHMNNIFGANAVIK